MRNDRRLKRRDRDWSFLSIKFPTVASTSMLLCNLKALLKMLAFIKPNVIKRRWCVDNSTILRSLDVGINLMRCFKKI
jgi:hypothetical protein